MKNLSLSLFAFHLYNTLDDAPNTTSQQANQLWESFRQVGQLLGCSNLDNLTSDLNLTNPDPRNGWLNPNRQSLKLEINDQKDYPITGELSAFLLHDTYCADLTLYPQDPQQEIDIEQLHVFQSIQLIDTIQADLGKIIWLTGESTDLNQLDQTKAKAWVSALAGQSSPRFLGEDILFNSPLFVFQTDNLTILISLAKPGTVDQTRVGKDYGWVRELLWSYSKITFVYQQAKDCYQKARKIYSQLENSLKSFYKILANNNSKRITEIEQLLQEIPKYLLDYTCHLRDLQAHHTTIHVNSINLKQCVEELEKLGDTLHTWSNFAQKNCPHYLNQVQTYIDYLAPGKELFNELTNSVRATAELEQVKNEQTSQRRLETNRKRIEKFNQKLQDQIQSIGVGIAAGAIVASCSSALIGQSIPNFIMAVICSSLTAGGAAYIQLIAIKKIRYPKYQSKFDKLLGKIFTRFFKPFHTQKYLNSQKDQDG